MKVFLSMTDVERHQGGKFQTTCWTDVLLSRNGSECPERGFEKLYKDYWAPLYAYVRRRGLTHLEAEEITQDFFATLIDKDRLAQVQRQGGRFRSFLLASIQHYMANQWERSRAAKRGGGAKAISLGDLDATGPGLEPIADAADAELSYDREWAEQILKLAGAKLEGEYTLNEKTAMYHALRPFLQGDREGRGYQEIALEFGMTEGAIRVAVHRMRHRYGEILREEVLRTVSSPVDVQEELRHLLRIMEG